MKSLSASNRHLGSASVRKDAVERNVRSSSAIEGVSATLFRSAANGRFVTTPGRNPRATVVVKNGRPKKK